MTDSLPNDSEESRLFIAVAVPDGLKKELLRMARNELRGVRWSKADQLHLTLHFLGEVSSSLIPTLSEALSRVVARRFTLTVDGCGFFPGSKRPRVFWLGFEASPALMHLHERLREVLLELNLEPNNKPFIPHLTMARMTNEYKPHRSNARIVELVKRSLGWSFEVDGFHLFSSDRRAKGASHTCIHSVPCRTINVKTADRGDHRRDEGPSHR